jgi:hypothetical protein
MVDAQIRYGLEVEIKPAGGAAAGCPLTVKMALTDVSPEEVVDDCALRAEEIA